jgi:Domain of unknown function DUF29
MIGWSPTRWVPVRSNARMSNQDLYDQDFYAWTNHQAGLLRDGRFSEADMVHIAEEIESMAGPRSANWSSRLTVLLLHLLKGNFSPGYAARLGGRRSGFCVALWTII